MKNTFAIVFSVLVLVLADCVRAQVSEPKKEYTIHYTQAQVVDSAEGMKIYAGIMKILQMDYELLYKDGGVAQGWNEEYYDNGQLMHISYYKEGKLVLFKNFFENGQCQNHVTYTDPANCNIDVYFETGGLKNQLHFAGGLPTRLTEFFANGLPKSQIEFDKESQYLSSKRTWFLNAEMQSELLLAETGKNKYTEKTFYPNGQIKESGELIYLAETKEYVKKGTWLTFENSGKKKSSEKFKVSLSSR